MADTWFSNFGQIATGHDVPRSGCNTMSLDDVVGDEADWEGHEFDLDPGPSSGDATMDATMDDMEEELEELARDIRGGPRRCQNWKIATRRRCDLEFKAWSCFWKGRKHAQDPLEMLKSADAADFVQYLYQLAVKAQETRDNTGIQNIRNRWTQVVMVAKDKVGRVLDRNTRAEVNEFCSNTGKLVQKLGLRVCGLDKPILSLTDWLEILHTIWGNPHMVMKDNKLFSGPRRRAQLWLYQHIAAYTANRTGAMTDNKISSTSHDYGGAQEQPLPCYRDCELIFWGPGPENDHTLIVLKITFRRRKGKSHLKKPIRFVLLPNPHLILCPVMSFLTMAFADDAFAPHNLRSPADLYRVVMPPDKRFVPIPFKEKVMDWPVFRSESGGPISSASIQNQLTQLGQATGFREVLTTYCIRRGTANAIHDAVSEAERNQILGHRSSKVFGDWYHGQDVTFDIQARVCGLPSQADIIRACTTMVIKRDQRYPQKPTAEMRKEAEEEAAVVKAKAQSEQAKENLVNRYGTLTQANVSDPKAGAELKRLKNALEKAREVARGKILKREQAKFVATQPTEDLTRLIDGKTLEGILPPEGPPEFSYPEHERVVKAFRATNSVEPGSPEDSQRRVALLTDLISLCGLSEPARAGNPEDQRTMHEYLDEDGRTLLDARTCIFCFWNSKDKVNSRHDRPSRMRKHFNRVHLPALAQKTPAELNCPDRLCTGVAFPDLGAFQTHIRHVHKAPLDGDARNKAGIRRGHGRDERGRARLGDTTCLICYFDAKFINPSIQYGFKRGRGMRQHAQRRHFDFWKTSDEATCPDPACAGRFFDRERFKEHADRVHWVRYF